MLNEQRMGSLVLFTQFSLCKKMGYKCSRGPYIWPSGGSLCFYILPPGGQPIILIELGEDMKMPIWEYNEKYYLKINAVKLKELPVESTCFKKDLPYIY